MIKIDVAVMKTFIQHVRKKATFIVQHCFLSRSMTGLELCGTSTIKGAVRPKLSLSRSCDMQIVQVVQVCGTHIEM